MNILLTNDDGIFAPGLWSAAEALVELGELVIVAPYRDHSGIGTATSLMQPVRVNEIHSRISGAKAYAVEGTPGDSVILALDYLLDEKVDVVVSGINQGANTGGALLLSGTVGAALQGYLRGISSLAISVAALNEVRYDVAALVSKLLAYTLGHSSFPNPIFLNVNLPNVSQNEIKGVEITQQGERNYLHTVRKGTESRGEYYWISADRATGHAKYGTDTWAIQNDLISITPIHTQMHSTNHASSIEVLRNEIIKDLKPK